MNNNDETTFFMKVTLFCREICIVQSFLWCGGIANIPKISAWVPYSPESRVVQQVWTSGMQRNRNSLSSLILIMIVVIIIWVGRDLMEAGGRQVAEVGAARRLSWRSRAPKKPKGIPSCPLLFPLSHCILSHVRVTPCIIVRVPSRKQRPPRGALPQSSFLEDSKRNYRRGHSTHFQCSTFCRIYNK